MVEDLFSFVAHNRVIIVISRALNRAVAKSVHFAINLALPPSNSQSIDADRCVLDINECEDPAISARCVENAWCCNLPAHFLCKCNAGFEGDGEVQCLGKSRSESPIAVTYQTMNNSISEIQRHSLTQIRNSLLKQSHVTDIDECARPDACGRNALCHNTPGNYSCSCPEGFAGNPYDGCVDQDECESPDACAPGAVCTNVLGGRQCHCPPGFEGDPYTTGCGDMDECSRSNPCGRDALCSNLEGSYRCACPPGYIGDPLTACSGMRLRSLGTSLYISVNIMCRRETDT